VFGTSLNNECLRRAFIVRRFFMDGPGCAQDHGKND
jgi:hypothetical protein